MDIMEEIKPSILSLFTPMIEQEIRNEELKIQKIINSKSQPKEVSREFNEGMNPVIMGKQSAHGLSLLKSKNSNLAFQAQGPMRQKPKRSNSFESLESAGSTGADSNEQ